MPRDGTESLRGLGGGGPSKVGTGNAMRARDVSREPVEADQATPAAGVGPARATQPADGSESGGRDPVAS